MEPALIDGLVTHCQSARFTGILRMRAREGIGEIWFLSGITSEVQFGVSAGDEAMDRMRQASDTTFELISRLPHPAGGFKRRFPAKGSIATATPVTLMRYCEQYALTCKLLVESGNVLVEATYELGDLVSVETTANDDGITTMLEAQEGTYEFTLPHVELPEGTPVLPPAAPLLESMPPDSLGIRALLEAKSPVGRLASDEAEVKRKTVELAGQRKKSAPVPEPSKPAVEKVEGRHTEPVKPTPVAKPAKLETKPAPIPTPLPPAPRPVVKSAPRPEPVRSASVPAPPKSPPPDEPVKPVSLSKPAKSPPPPAVTPEVAKTPDAVEMETDNVSDPPEVEEKPRPKKRAPSTSKRSSNERVEKAKPPARTSSGPWIWLLLFLLVAASVGYLYWTKRI